MSKTALRGGISGGTLASMMGPEEEVRASAQRRGWSAIPMRSALIARPNPAWAPRVTRAGPKYDSELRMWTGAVRHGQGSTPAWYAAATRCRAGPMAAGSATGRSPGSAPARPHPAGRHGQRRRRPPRQGWPSAIPGDARAAAGTRSGPRRKDPPHGLFSASRSIPGPRPGYGTWP